MNPQQLYHSFSALLLYQGILQDPAIAAFVELLQALHQPGDAMQAPLIRQRYGQWFYHLAHLQKSWPAVVLDTVLSDQNPFSQHVQQQTLDQLSTSLLNAARQDLRLLFHIQTVSLEQLAQWAEQATQTVTAADSKPFSPSSTPGHFLLPEESNAAGPAWLNATEDWSEQVEAFAQHYRQQGTGIFGRFRALRWNGTALEGIPDPDPIALAQLVGYDHPKQELLKNTARLLRGHPALHVLLYGSRGTGKSSLVKALVNQYADSGLRLIELPKTYLIDLPQLLDQLRQTPQKFVIFVDDLSFDADDESFKALKVVLEGSVTARPSNVVVYATSNRRHLVREFHQDRPALRSSDRRSFQSNLNAGKQDEVHAWDTVQEKLSFSDRFGLTLTFTPAQQDTYLTIVRHLAEYYQLQLPVEELEFRARQWATRNNGQSGRTARQFIDWLRGEEQGNDEGTDT